LVQRVPEVRPNLGEQDEPEGVRMTKHWKTEVRGYGVAQYETECAGCTYLRSHGLPKSFIKFDHEKETGQEVS